MKRQHRIAVTVAAFTLLLFAAQPAAAQRAPAASAAGPAVPLGSRVPRWDAAPMAGEREAERIMRSFANCVVRTKSAQAAALLRTMPETAEQLGILNALVGRESACLTARQMRISKTLLRGAIAEALVTRAPFAAAPLPEAARVEDFGAYSARMTAADMDEVTAEDGANLVGRWLAECVAAEHPELIRTVLASGYGSDAERRALRAAQPAFSSCLLEGQARTVDRLTMRGLLAEALYRRLAMRLAAAASPLNIDRVGAIADAPPIASAG